MKYVGSKNRLAKYLLPIILKDRTKDQWYVEPFCGGCNLIDKVTGKRIANDVNFYLIEFLKAVAEGWLPEKNFPESLYYAIKDNPKNYPPEVVGYAGFQLSYNGKFFGGYAGRTKIKDGSYRDYPSEARRNILQQSPLLSGIRFRNVSYDELYIPDNSVVYCDPPYVNTTDAYKTKFDSEKFWNWVREASKTNTVFVSEYAAPEDFKCVWSKEVVSSLDLNTGGKRNVERLFTL